MVDPYEPDASVYTYEFAAREKDQKINYIR